MKLHGSLSEVLVVSCWLSSSFECCGLFCELSYVFLMVMNLGRHS